MGRPRLHNTPEEAAAAARKYRQKYYQLNREIINFKSKAKYRASQGTRSSALSEDKDKSKDKAHMVCVSAEEDHATPLTRAQSNSSRISTPIVRSGLTLRELIRLQPSLTVKQQLKALVGDSMSSYMNSLYSEIVVRDTDSALSLVRPIVSVAERIQLHARHKENEILYTNGLGDFYRAANKASQLAQAVLNIGWVLLGMQITVVQIVCTLSDGYDYFTLCYPKNPTIPKAPLSQKQSAINMSKWATPEQEAWLEAHFHAKYKPCMPTKNYTSFWPTYFKEWSEKWPERSLCPELKDKPAGEHLTDAENAILVAAVLKRKEQLTNKMRWFAGKGTRTRTLLSGPKNKALGTLASFGKGTRAPQTREVFVKLEADAKTSYADTIRQRLDALAEQEGWQGDRAALMKARQEITKQVYEEAGEDVKALVEAKKAELTQIMHEKKKASKLSKLPRTPEEIQNSIDVMPATMAKALVDLHELTGWSYTLLAGGPQLSEGGTLKSLTIHVGENKVGKDFGSALVGFKDKIVRPFDMYLRTVYPANICDNGASASDSRLCETNVAESSQMATSGFDSDATFPDSGFGTTLPTTLHASLGAPLLPPSVPSSIQQQAVAPFGFLANASDASFNGSTVQQQAIAPFSFPTGSSVTSFNNDPPSLSLMPPMRAGAFYRTNPELDSAIPFDFDEFGNIKSTTPERTLPGRKKSISTYTPPQPNVPFAFGELGHILSDEWSSSNEPSPASPSSLLPPVSSPISSLSPLSPIILPLTGPLLTPATWPVTTSAPDGTSVPIFTPPSPVMPPSYISDSVALSATLSLPILETRETTTSIPIVQMRDPVVVNAPSSLHQTHTSTGGRAPPRLRHFTSDIASQPKTALETGQIIQSSSITQSLSLPVSTPPRLRHYTTASGLSSHIQSCVQNPNADTIQPSDNSVQASADTCVYGTETDESLPDGENPVPDPQPEEPSLGRPKRVRTASKRREKDNAIGLTPPAKRTAKKSARPAK
ncbi:hypothetical protein BJ138DRAFT_1222030 [Hygrophoropsis aurantiaca]|uniref:Uncharacterized protein n=1 Tax=Hygrophoropsis aurantiaca TaxID=72124 RepID=A0ACB7ZZ33_9AGAM|nr:hypothetical protein BJ138DRAFT_1222030 [Hygrophoropsis aurantiaca]